jgi:hypothetical protein
LEQKKEMTTQTRSRQEIRKRIEDLERVKDDLVRLRESADTTEAKNLLRKEILKINADLRIFYNVHAALTKTINNA